MEKPNDKMSTEDLSAFFNTKDGKLSYLLMGAYSLSIKSVNGSLASVMDNVNVQNQFGQTALHLAACRKFDYLAILKGLASDSEATKQHMNGQIVIRILSEKPDLSLEDDDGFTALDYAIESENLDALYFLFDAGANKFTMDSKKTTITEVMRDEVKKAQFAKAHPIAFIAVEKLKLDMKEDDSIGPLKGRLKIGVPNFGL